MKHKGVTLKNIDIIRKRVVAGQVRELTSLRGFISSVDGNQEAVERLRGESGQLMLAVVTDCIMSQLGAPTAEGGEKPNSPASRAVKKALKAKGGKHVEDEDEDETETA
jgi:hypothetical protein